MTPNPFTTTRLPASRARYHRAVLAGVVAFIDILIIAGHLLTPAAAQPPAAPEPYTVIATARPPAPIVPPIDHAPAASVPLPTLAPTIAPAPIEIAPAPAPAPALVDVEAPAPVEQAPAVEVAPAPAPAPTPYPQMTAQPAICQTGCNGGVGPVQVAPVAPAAAEFVAPDPRARCQLVGCLPGR